MNMSPDRWIENDAWSDLTRTREMPDIDHERLYAWRIARLRAEIAAADVALLVAVNPISLRYALDYRVFGQFQSHIPTAYAFIPAQGPLVLNGAYGQSPPCADESRVGRPINFFDGGSRLTEHANALAADIDEFLREIGATSRRVALECVNPSLSLALARLDIDVVDGVPIAESARVTKSDEELACMRWAIAVAEHGIAKMQSCVHPGISELQLFGILNYANLANNGDWHDGRMLASGPRINPWLQEASPRKVEAGDLVGFDTDMIGPFGYCADISRTFYCGDASPTPRQKALYRLAYAEIEHNLKLLRPGVRFSEIQSNAYAQDEAFHENAYTCVMHAVGMCDEYPRINPIFRGPNPYEGVIEPRMVLCVESYVGAIGESDGVKLEEQVLITDDGYEVLTQYPFEEKLLD